MEIDVRKLISVTLYTVMNNGNRRIISWDDIVIYIKLLEEKLGKEIKFIYDNTFDESRYEDFIQCNVKNSNTYFTLNPKYHIQQITSINEILLDPTDCQFLINRKMDDNTADELVVLNRNQHNREYQEQVPLEQILKKRPVVNLIKFEGLFKVFMLYYSVIYKNNIKKEYLKEAINDITDILRSKHIMVESMNNLCLFRTIYDKNNGQKLDNPNRRFNLNSNDEVTINITNLNGYLSELKELLGEKNLKFIKRLVAYYVTTPQFENKIFYNEIFEKEKGI